MTKPDLLISGEQRGSGRMHDGAMNATLENEQAGLVRDLKAIEK